MTLPNIPKKIRDKLYPILVKRDGEFCQYCRKTCFEANVKTLELHHIKYDYPLNNPDNYKLLCHSCNHRKELRKQIIENDNEISASHRANIGKHPIFLEWLSNEMSDHNYNLPKYEIINSGAYISGANIVTVARWLKPLISNEGPFSEADVLGIPTVFLKGKESRLELSDNSDLK